jgi:ubiquinone/menaquinone biosynthesis C-methylase UbiE
MKRVVTTELLDTDQGTPAEIVASLADLRWFNRYFGGLSTTTSLLLDVAEKLRSETISYLDIAGASGDGALAAQRELAKRGVLLTPTLLDRVASHLPSNRAAIAAINADALHLPFADGSFDVVGSSLFIHHLEPQEVIRVIRESLRVCRHAVIVNDLRRSTLHYLTALAGIPLYRSRITRNDAPASVRRAYIPAEILELLKNVEHAGSQLTTHYFFRMGFVIWRKNP